ncbi:nucleoside 2-deoxyribosyltransferase [Bradyrhizobium sp. S3.3.6]|uniref:Nucleoside 2-deoxyribosyltransferase n=1 Tax=Bradyrhizobium cytisi TaxID=515489 RepID=A0A5S4XB80_9BRAD|nr:nucleoside 2-deoxyribosyltransferase [Bradyrhizobium cytisi]TYL86712.1 nucleoside 2-deoxyribosyltransferase [Bradyrhizobium cytisi]
MPKVYLAGPDVFLPDAIEIGRQKKLLCSRYGLEGLFPFDNEITTSESGQRVDRLIYRANEAMMRNADLGIFNLTPFRGPSADAGTVFELGLMVGLGKRVFGYTNDASDYAHRVSTSAATGLQTRPLQDAHGMTVENFGNSDNLMIEWSVVEHGGFPIVRNPVKASNPFDDLSGFERCVRLASEALLK